MAMNIDIANLPNSAEELKKLVLDLLPYKEQCDCSRKKCEILLEEIRLAKQQRFSPLQELKKIYGNGICLMK